MFYRRLSLEDFKEAYEFEIEANWEDDETFEEAAERMYSKYIEDYEEAEITRWEMNNDRYYI